MHSVDFVHAGSCVASRAIGTDGAPDALGDVLVDELPPMIGVGQALRVVGPHSGKCTVSQSPGSKSVRGRLGKELLSNDLGRRPTPALFASTSDDMILGGTGFKTPGVGGVFGAASRCTTIFADDSKHAYHAGGVECPGVSDVEEIGVSKHVASSFECGTGSLDSGGGGLHRLCDSGEYIVRHPPASKHFSGMDTSISSCGRGQPIVHRIWWR